MTEVGISRRVANYDHLHGEKIPIEVLPTKSKAVLGTYSTPHPHQQQGGARDLFYPISPLTARGCWGHILPHIPTNNKGMLETYSTPYPHQQQGGARDLFYPISPLTARGCWRPILPHIPTNSKGVLGTYSTPHPH